MRTHGRVLPRKTDLADVPDDRLVQAYNHTPRKWTIKLQGISQTSALKCESTFPRARE